MSDKKPQLHFSSLDTLWKCGEKFYRRHVIGERLPVTTAIVVGKGVDESTNRNLQNKIDTGALLSVDETLDTTRDAVARSIAEEDVKLMPDEVLRGEKRVHGETMDKAVRLARKHATGLAPRLKPKHVQREWALEIEGFPFDLVGTRDLDETTGAIRDLKTSGKSPAPDLAHRTDQLTMYALSKATIDGTPAPIAVYLDTIVDLKAGPVIKTLSSRRHAGDFQVLLNRVENAAEILRKGAFTPANQTDWWCSPKWCGFYETCRYARNLRQFSLGGTAEAATEENDGSE